MVLRKAARTSFFMARVVLGAGAHRGSAHLHRRSYRWIFLLSCRVPGLSMASVTAPSGTGERTAKGVWGSGEEAEIKQNAGDGLGVAEAAAAENARQVIFSSSSGRAASWPFSPKMHRRFYDLSFTVLCAPFLPYPRLP